MAKIIVGMGVRLPWWWRPYCLAVASGIALGLPWSMDDAGRRVAKHARFYTT